MRTVDLLRAQAEYGYGELLKALEGVSERHAWARLPEVGNDYINTDGSIQGIVLHVASGKRMYGSVSFRNSEFRWRGVAEEMDRFEPDWNAALRYLEESHRYWLSTWADLSDEDLETVVPHPVGQSLPAWRILEIVIHHDSYHAGQIALLRYAAGESSAPPPKYADDIRQYCSELPNW